MRLDGNDASASLQERRCLRPNSAPTSMRSAPGAMAASVTSCRAHQGRADAMPSAVVRRPRPGHIQLQTESGARVGSRPRPALGDGVGPAEPPPLGHAVVRSRSTRRPTAAALLGAGAERPADDAAAGLRSSSPARSVLRPTLRKDSRFVVICMDGRRRDCAPDQRPGAQCDVVRRGQG
jgi:hypothetical protein